MIDVLGVNLCDVVARAFLVDDRQARIDARAVPREHLSSNGCRKDDVLNQTGFIGDDLVPILRLE